MNVIITSGIISVFVVLYFIWRKHSALKAKEEVANQLNKLLEDKHLPDDVKMSLYHAWSISDSYKLFFEVLEVILASPTKTKRKERHGKQKESYEKAQNLLFKIFWTNAKLMPIAYLLLVVIGFTLAVMAASINRPSRKTKESIRSYLTEPHHI